MMPVLSLQESCFWSQCLWGHKWSLSYLDCNSSYLLFDPHLNKSTTRVDIERTTLYTLLIISSPEMHHQ